MHYVMSDIHGCYEEYLAALEKISFSDNDTMYVLGDCIDRGPDSIRLLKDMMMRYNVFPLTGDHEWMACEVLNAFCHAQTDKEIRKLMTPQLRSKFQLWTDPRNGGMTTWKEFRELPEEDREDIVDYLGEFAIYEEVSTDGEDYLLVHGGMEPFQEGKTVDDYSVEDLVWSRADYSRPYYTDKYTITGHTPTVCEPGNTGTIIRRNNHIAIDCGCVYGYNLAVFCMETGEEFYVPSRQKMK